MRSVPAMVRERKAHFVSPFWRRRATRSRFLFVSVATLIEGARNGFLESWKTDIGESVVLRMGNSASEIGENLLDDVLDRDIVWFVERAT